MTALLSSTQGEKIQKMTLAQVQQKFGVSHTTVYKWDKEYNWVRETYNGKTYFHIPVAFIEQRLLMAQEVGAPIASITEIRQPEPQQTIRTEPIERIIPVPTPSHFDQETLEKIMAVVKESYEQRLVMKDELIAAERRLAEKTEELNAVQKREIETLNNEIQSKNNQLIVLRDKAKPERKSWLERLFNKK